MLNVRLTVPFTFPFVLVADPIFFYRAYTAMNKKQRKRHEKKMAAKAAAQPRKIPLHEQTIDITPAKYNAAEQDGPQDITAKSAAALEKKEQITKSAREARRKGIRESNFLRGL